MSTAWNLRQIKSGDQRHRPALDTTILYEDLPTGLRANFLLNRIAEQLDLGNDIRMDLLRTDTTE